MRLLLRLHVASLAAAALLAAACRHAPLAESDADPTPGDAAVADTAPAPTPLGSGRVTLEQVRVTGAVRSTASAQFTSRVSTLVVPSDCVERFIGPCRTLTCPVFPRAGREMISAGDIAVTNDAARAQPLILQPAMVTSDYTFSTANEERWPQGGHVFVVATGADVPAFMTTVQIPAFALTSPRVGEAPAPIERSGSYTVTWSAASANVTALVVQPSVPDSAPRAEVRCTFPAADLTGTIASEALSVLQAGEATTLQVFAANVTSLNAGGYAVTVEANWVEISSDVEVR